MSQKLTLVPHIANANKPPFSVESLGHGSIPGETRPRRNRKVGAGKLLSVPENGVNTVFDLLERSVLKYGEAPAVGTRKTIRVQTEAHRVPIPKQTNSDKPELEERGWPSFERGPYSYTSFQQYKTLVYQIGAAYRKLGLVKADKVHFANWLAIAHGAASQSMAFVTAYEALGAAGLTISLLATGAKAIFLDPYLLSTLVIALKSTPPPDVQIVVYNIIMSFEELRSLGEEHPVAPEPPGPEDLCAIFYTSGSTGLPKGVPVKHSAVVAAVAGLDSIIGDYLGAGDSYLAYLPLAHVLEFAFENACLFWGTVMGYGNAKTLFDTSMKNSRGDLREFRPTFLIGVPAIWEMVRKKMIAKVEEGGILSQNLFWAALKTKEFLVARGLPGGALIDALILHAAREITGSRFKFGMSGGGPVAQNTQRFLSSVIGPLVNGYGLTETMAIGGLMDPTEWHPESLGNIPACIEMKLVDYPEAGYFAGTDPPQGEIWIRGNCVMEGYWQNEKETAEAITSDGWFKTGDIGEWEPNGHFKIIDRKKNLVKTLNGEYIALEKVGPSLPSVRLGFYNAQPLESIYRSAWFVANICMYASPSRTRPIAIIAPAPAALERLAADNGIEYLLGSKDPSHNDNLRRLVMKQLQTLGSSAGLARIEIVEGVVLADDGEWTPQNGMATSVGKLNRGAILKRYQKEIDMIYGGG
ncbi:long-chain fatty acid-CoA ligase [Xylographa bjoerkii]|nr:long-chain fatty acid-CoA ligase [Xylographa bjoerkii]